MANVSHHLPSWRELKALASMTSLGSRSSRSELRYASVRDVRRAALRSVPRSVFDYVDGAAEAEVTNCRAREVFSRVEFRPRVLNDVSTVSTRSKILGRECSMPVILAPTGFTRLMHHDGEVAVVAASGSANIPYTLSTLGTTSIEDLALAGPDADRWFQLYFTADRGYNKDLIGRAAAGGYRALVVTVDAPVGGRRLRDIRNGFTIPPRVTPKTLLEMSRKPRWWINLVTSPPLEFASMADSGGTVSELMSRVFDPTLNWQDIDWIRDQWEGPLVVKGVQTTADAERSAKIGADAVWLSNHGGRQLDRAPVMLELVAGTREALPPETELFVDGGVLSGSDIMACVAFGATAVAVGRAYLYGLMAGGEHGVAGVLRLLKEELTIAMTLVGSTCTQGLGPDLVAFR